MGSRILLADDSITIQKVVNLTFADEGIEVVSVSNGDLAERRLREINPDLVLADIFMPGKNGYELCETIKNNPQFSNVPVVLLVGAFEPFNEIEAQRVQADAHLTKPFESRLLVETVRSLIAKNPQAKVSSAPLPSQPEADHAPPASAVKMPAFNLDMAAMGAPPPPADTVFADHAPISQASESTPFTDSFPSSFGNQNSRPATIEFTTPNTAGASPHDAAVDATRPFYSFEQAAPGLTAPEAVEHPPAAYPADETDNLWVGDTEGGLPIDPAGSGLGAGFEAGSNDVLVDFDRVESWDEPAPEKAVLFDVEAAEPAASSSGQLAEVDDSDDLRTRKLDTNELLDAPDAHLAAGAGSRDFSFYESPDSATTILKSEEPLGDILSNSLPQNGYTLMAASPTPLELDEPVGEAQMAEAQTADNQTAETRPDVRPGDDAAAAEASAETLPGQEPSTGFAIYTPESTPEFSATVEEVEPAAAADHRVDVLQPAPASADSSEKTISSGMEYNFLTEPSPPAADVAAVEAVTTTAPLPPTQPLPGAAGTVETAPSADAETDTAAAMAASDLWAEQPQFTPISVEMSPVAEATPPAPTPEAGRETPAAVADSAPATAGAGVELSQEMIDEIVRRVVAQLSDQVVREVAWEVVPDCVERVISSLTREGLGNRK